MDTSATETVFKQPLTHHILQTSSTAVFLRDLCDGCMRGTGARLLNLPGTCNNNNIRYVNKVAKSTWHMEGYSVTSDVVSDKTGREVQWKLFQYANKYETASVKTEG